MIHVICKDTCYITKKVPQDDRTNKKQAIEQYVKSNGN